MTLLKLAKQLLGPKGKNIASVALTAAQAVPISKGISFGSKAAKFAPKAVSKAAKFLFFAETPVKTITKTAKTLAAGAVVAGGGLSLVPPVLKGIKKSTEKVVEYTTSTTDQPFPTREVVEVAGAAAGLGALAAATNLLIKEFREGREKESPATPPPSLPPDKPTPPISSTVPLTSQTQVLEAGTSLPSKRRKARRRQRELAPVRITNRNINIIGVRSR